MAKKDKTNRDPLPDEFATLTELAEFWDTHDLTDYEDYLIPVSVEITSFPRTYHKGAATTNK